MKKELDYVALLTVVGLPEYSKKEVKRTVSWLRKVAGEIEKEKDLKIYAKNPRFRLMD